MQRSIDTCMHSYIYMHICFNKYAHAWIKWSGGLHMLRIPHAIKVRAKSSPAYLYGTRIRVHARARTCTIWSIKYIHTCSYREQSVVSNPDIDRALPISLRYLPSVAAGKISGLIFMFSLSSSVDLNTRYQLFFSTSKEVVLLRGSPCWCPAVFKMKS